MPERAPTSFTLFEHIWITHDNFRYD